MKVQCLPLSLPLCQGVHVCCKALVTDIALSFRSLAAGAYHRACVVCSRHESAMLSITDMNQIKCLSGFTLVFSCKSCCQDKICHLRKACTPILVCKGRSYRIPVCFTSCCAVQEDIPLFQSHLPGIFH